jgi:uncharacterized protein (DUF2235 family)
MSTQAGKNIIICSDGTGNTSIKGRGTNVFKIFESVDLNGHRFDPTLRPQVATYDDGVGTEDFKLLRLMGGAFGWGLGRNVRQLYKELCRIYDEHDNIYLFGFSRGAFTARTLAGFILKCGIIDVSRIGDSDSLEAKVNEAYAVYRRCYRTSLARIFRGEPDGEEANSFKQKYCHPEKNIRFIGVWDTVDAVGLPIQFADFVNATIYPFKFPNLQLSDRVERAAHALAIDDERKSFHPLVWDESKSDAKRRETLQQVWFAGAHSNVGGGYPKQGMSLVALDWMMSQAEVAGLRFVATDREFYHHHATVDDKLYDPRSGLGVLYRWEPRDISKLCDKSKVHPKLHVSVMERIAHGTEDYCPGNLPTNATVVTTSTHDAVKDAAITARAAETQKVLQDAHAHGTPLLHQAHREVSIGRNSYRLFAVSCIGAVALVASITVANGIEPGYNFGYVSAVASQLPNYLVAALAVAGGLIGSFALAAYCDKGMLQRFSSFWFKQQKELRRALKDARRTAIPQSVGVPVQPAKSLESRTDPINVLRLTPDAPRNGHDPTSPVLPSV